MNTQDRFSSRRRPAVAALLLLLVAAAGGCGNGNGAAEPPRPAPTPAEPSRSATAAAGRPNVVIFFTDDIGYADLGTYGSPDIPTPHIDTLARDGVRFTSGYVPSPICSPSRAGLLTGRYPSRFGFACNVEANQGEGLPDDEVTLAELLSAAGYATGMVGRWHLGGSADQSHPLASGFQEFFGTLRQTGSHVAEDGQGLPIVRGTEMIQEMEIKSDAYAREAVAFIHRHRERPFFLYIPTDIAHTPIQRLEKYAGQAAHIEDPARLDYASMLVALDEAVGRVLEKLRQEELEERTLVFFLNDNGAPYMGQNEMRSNAPLRGGKHRLTEGGIRVPFLLRWTGHLPAGLEYAEPVISLDVLPTVAAAAGIALPGDRPIDGVDLLPFLSGENSSPPHEALYWRACGKSANRAIRMGEWKLLTRGEDDVKLFHLAKDIGERKNLAQGRPERLEMMLQRLDQWTQETEPAAAE